MIKSSVYPSRAYASTEEVQPGDCVRMLRGTPGCGEPLSEPDGFADSIVAHITPMGMVELVRPHISIDVWGTVKVQTERYHVELARLVQHYHVLTTGHTGRRDNRLHPVPPYFTVLIPWSDTPTRFHPTEKTGPFSELVRGSFPTPTAARRWADEHLGGQPYSLRYIDPMNDPEVVAHYERITGYPLDFTMRAREAWGEGNDAARPSGPTYEPEKRR